MRRGAAYRLVRARTLRNEESKMCHTSRVAWYKLTSARVCFGAALCFGFLFVPNGGPALAVQSRRRRRRRRRRRAAATATDREGKFKLNAPLSFQEKHGVILQRSALITRL